MGEAWGTTYLRAQAEYNFIGRRANLLPSQSFREDSFPVQGRGICNTRVTLQKSGAEHNSKRAQVLSDLT